MKRFLAYVLIAAFLTACGTSQPAYAATSAQSITFLLSQVRQVSGPLSGGKVYAYAAGTTTPKTIWTDRGKTTPAANPYTLDSNGTAQLYGDGLYRFVIKTSTGVTVYDRDNISIRDALTYGIPAEDYATLALADTAAVSAGAQLVISTVYTNVPAALNAPAVKILPGGKLNGNGTVAIAGQFEGATGCFGVNQSVTGLQEARRPEWWGYDVQKATASTNTSNDIYTGGKVLIGTGNHAVNSTVQIDNDSIYSILGVTLAGTGKQAAVLSFAGQPAGQNGLEYTSPIFAGINDLGVRESKGAGVRLVGYNTNPANPSWNHFNMDRVRSSFNTGAGVDADRGFMGNFNQVFASHNGGGGFQFRGFHTSLHLNNSYAASNTGNGYTLLDATYSALTACAADTNSQHGYKISKSSTIVMNASGAESNGRSAVAVESSTALGQNYPVTINGLLAFNNNTANAGYPNAIWVKSSDSVPSVVLAKGCRSHSPANPTVDALVDGVGAYLVDEYNSFPNGVASVNGGYIHHVQLTKYIHGLSVTGATTVCTLRSPQNQAGTFGGEVLILARNNAANSNAGNTALYKLLVNRGAGGDQIVLMASTGLISGAGASFPSFTWTLSGNALVATPIGSTSGTFYFEILTQGFVKTE